MLVLFRKYIFLHRADTALPFSGKYTISMKRINQNDVWKSWEF